MQKKSARRQKVEHRQELHSRVLEVMELLKTEHPQVSVEMLHEAYKMKFGDFQTSNTLGQILKALRTLGSVDYKIFAGNTLWFLTGAGYAKDEPYQMVVYFPSYFKPLIDKFAKRGGLTKTAFVVNMVSSGIQGLVDVGLTDDEIKKLVDAVS